MKRIFLAIYIISLLASSATAVDFVILHTNDTHSMIDPDHDGKGGILRRKVLIDSIRSAEPEVLLIDAGDVVQGTPYFSLFGGEVEFALMDSLGYDIMILGNHEFDNGAAAIAKYYSGTQATKLSTNYIFEDSLLRLTLHKYDIRQIGDKKIAFIGINLDPVGMIAAENSRGIAFLPPIATADTVAAYLKKHYGADAVIAITHIGYKLGNGKDDDVTLAKRSRNIDLIIGGHSHTALKPADSKHAACTETNAAGALIPICQSGASGKNLGYIKISLTDTLTATSKLIPVDSRLDAFTDSTLAAFIAPYKHVVDSMMNHTIAVSDVFLPNRRSAETMNWIADIAYTIGKEQFDSNIDLAIMNKGGMRRELPTGNISEGLIGAMFPFENRLVILEIDGADLIDAFAVMATRGGDAVSKGVEIIYDSNGKIKTATLNGESITAGKKYRLLTLDYLANGGDYMVPLTKAIRTATAEDKFGTMVINHLKQMGNNGVHITASGEQRMIKE